MKHITQDGIIYSYHKYQYNNTRYELFNVSGYIGGLLLEPTTKEYWIVLDEHNKQIDSIHTNHFTEEMNAIEWAVHIIINQ